MHCDAVCWCDPSRLTLGSTSTQGAALSICVQPIVQPIFYLARCSYSIPTNITSIQKSINKVVQECSHTLFSQAGF